MAEKKWSDYWRKYKSSDKGKPSPKGSTKKERPTIKVSPKIPKISAPKTNINLKSVFLILLALGVLGLGFWQFKSAKLIETLKEEELSLERQLVNCTEQLENTNGTLMVCSSNLDDCNDNLANKISRLNSCENEKSNINQDYEDCVDDLLQADLNYQDLEDDYNDCRSVLGDRNDALDECNSDLNALQSDYDDLKDNYRSLCNNNCSQDCTFDSGTQEYECPQTTTTTTTPTTTTSG